MNSIRPQTVTLAAVAVIVGLITAYGAKTLLTPKPVEQQTIEKPKTVSVVVAQTNLTEYARISDRDVAAVEVPEADVQADWMRVKARAMGRLVKGTILAGHPVRDEDLYPPGTVPKIADQLPAGFRAVALRVEDEIASNGAIQPGSFVDVSLTFDSDHPDVDGTATVNLLRHLQVLSPNPVNVNRDSYGQLAQKDRFITVAATPEQANRLILAQKYGVINVTLCSSNEQDADVLTEGTRHLVNKVDLLGLPPLPLEPVYEPPIRRVVEIYRGTNVEQVVFNEAGELLATEFAMAGPAGRPAEAAAGASQRKGVQVKSNYCPGCAGKKKVTFAAPGTSAQNTGGTSAQGGTVSHPTPAVRPQATPPPPAPASFNSDGR
jgi:pilus assembly protein CpaB